MKRYFLLFFLLQISSNQLFGHWKDLFTKNNLVYGVCAVPLAVDLGIRIFANVKPKNNANLFNKSKYSMKYWNSELLEQVGSGLTTVVGYSVLLYCMKNNKLPGNSEFNFPLVVAGFFVIPMASNIIANCIAHKRTSKEYCLNQVKRGLVTGVISSGIFGLMKYKEII